MLPSATVPGRKPAPWVNGSRARHTSTASDFVLGAPVEQALAGEQFVHDQSERVQVALRPESGSLDLFGGHVGGGAEEGSSPGEA